MMMIVFQINVIVVRGTRGTACLLIFSHPPPGPISATD